MSTDRRKVRIGRVVSNKMDKTVTVVVEWRRPHPIYHKAVRRRTRFKAHDEHNQCLFGDLVRIVETRPLSKTKRWRVADILSRQERADIQPEEIAVPEVDVLSAAAVAAAPVLQEAESQQTAAVAPTLEPGHGVAESVAVTRLQAAEAVAVEVEVAPEAPVTEVAGEAQEEAKPKRATRRRSVAPAKKEEAPTAEAVTTPATRKRSVARAKKEEAPTAEAVATPAEAVAEPSSAEQPPLATGELAEEPPTPGPDEGPGAAEKREE